LSFEAPRPDESVIRGALSAHLPHLASERIEPLGMGWAFWAYRAGDTVLRFPRSRESTETLAVEAAVMRELGPTLPLPVSVIEVHENGPNGLPFTSHRLVRGIPVIDLPRQLADEAGAVLGRFIKAMHAFPVERAAALGLANPTPKKRLEDRVRFLFMEVTPRVFPLVSEEARRHVWRTFKAFLDEPSHFEWQAVVTHRDIDARNVLADPATGALTGVVDWGDLSIADPAGDFIDAQRGGLARLGLREQLDDLLDAYGMTRAELETMRPRSDFYEYCWPLHEIIYGLNSRQDDVKQKGIEYLYETVARDG
jgi:aminoglycoside 2''-phosphotransferase